MYAGTPAHYPFQVRNYLNETNFSTQVNDRDSNFVWLVRNPDLNSLNFHFWGHLKDLVYNEQITTCENKLKNLKIMVANI